MRKGFLLAPLWQTVLLGTCGIITLPSVRGAESSSIDIARQLNEAFVRVAETVSPAVVVLEVIQKSDDAANGSNHPLFEALPDDLRKKLEEYFGNPQRGERPPIRRLQGMGSGVIIRKDGYILTNTHVVEDAEKIVVRLNNLKEYEAKGVWTDPQSDLAVVKIEADDLVVAKLGDSAKTRVGEFAIAIGAPFVLDYSVTFGHVSAKGRSHVVPTWSQDSLGAIMDQDFLQTDASINPGNSGGPLVNIEGEVIGINTLIRGMGTGIGFAIPSNLARNVADQLISQGHFARAWIGVGTGPLRESRRQVEGIDDGLVVSHIEERGPAAKSDLRVNDIILAVDGHKVRTVQELRNAVRARKIGSELTLDVFRRNAFGADQNMKVLVTTEEWRTDKQAIAVVAAPAENLDDAVDTMGLTVQTLTQELADQFKVDLVTGVIVTGVKKGSPADTQQFQPGDIITAIDNQSVATPREFISAIKSAGNKGVMIKVISHASAQEKNLKDGGD